MLKISWCGPGAFAGAAMFGCVLALLLFGPVNPASGADAGESSPASRMEHGELTQHDGMPGHDEIMGAAEPSGAASSDGHGGTADKDAMPGHGDAEAHAGMAHEQDMSGNGDMTDHSEAAHQKAAEEAAASRKADQPPVGVVEKLGDTVADATFTDASGNTVNLRELIDAPTVLLPIYYRCPNVCQLLQASFARILPQVPLTPGKELKIISLSFDDRENAQDAARARKTIAAQLDGRFPIDQWRFLAGDQAEIDRALGSMGITVERQGGIYAHPVGAVVLAPGGKIVRYLYGQDFLPFDVTMAATEAAEGKTGLSIKRVLAYCYNYDPEGRRYVFDIMRVSGTVILGSMGVLLLVLLLAGRRKKKNGRR